MWPGYLGVARVLRVQKLWLMKVARVPSVFGEGEGVKGQGSNLYAFLQVKMVRTNL